MFPSDRYTLCGVWENTFMPWKPVTIDQLKEGDTIRLEGGATIRIQKVVGRRGSFVEVITDEGLPVGIHDTEDLVRLEQ